MPFSSGNKTTIIEIVNRYANISLQVYFSDYKRT
jgi:hypothetical protein